MFGLQFTWHWSPVSLAVLTALCLLYAAGVYRGLKRPLNGAARLLKATQFWAFVLCVLLLGFCLLTPLDWIARTQLFSAHMLQATIITTFCAPLLLFACPAWLFEPLLQASPTRGLLKFLTQPVLASVLFNGTFLLWHTPALFGLAHRQGNFYHVMLWSIFFTALLNWWPLIGPVRDLHKLTYPQQMFYAFLDGQPVDIFALVLVFSGVVLYPFYAVPAALNISAFADQAVGGAFLLLPGLVDLVVMSPLFFRWLGQIEAKARLNDDRLQKEAEAEAELAAYLERER